MSDLIVSNSNKNVTIVTSPEQQAATPKWFGEAVLIAQIWLKSGLLSALNEKVKVVRGRMGRYEVLDFTLLLLGYAVSQEISLRDYFKGLFPFRSALSGLWERDKCPCASALSRFLGDVSDETVKALRKLLFEDLLSHGMALEQMGGLYDRTGSRHIVFDIDATKDAASVPTSADYPPARRRRTNYAAGYSGRKRGEVVRSRTTVQQAHSQEWLSTFGAAGNGDIWQELEQGCQLIKLYMEGKGLNPSQALARLDGAYGWARAVSIYQQNCVGYLSRCCDYKLLEMPEIKHKLQATAMVEFHQIETNTARELYDLGFINWQASKDKSILVTTRLIVACSAATGGKPAIGKLQDNKVYELFITSSAANELTAADVVSLYFGRAGFEQTLSCEDAEQDPDRFCSQSQAGQEFWQLLAQWLWNARLRLGVVAQTPALRRILWAQACTASEPAPMPTETEGNSQTEIVPIPETTEIETVSPIADNKLGYATTASAPTRAELAAGNIKMAQSFKDGLTKFGGDKFLLQPDGTILCPALKTLTANARLVEAKQIRIVYQAKKADCRACLLAQDCRSTPNPNKPRRVGLLLPKPATSVDEQNTARPIATVEQNPVSRASLVSNLPLLPRGTEPLFWLDLPALTLRRSLPALLRTQHFEINLPGLPLLTQSTFLTRAQRAHRRLSWHLRLLRNAAPVYSSPCLFRFFGLPPEIAAYLSNLTALAA